MPLIVVGFSCDTSEGEDNFLVIDLFAGLLIYLLFFLGYFRYPFLPMSVDITWDNRELALFDV